MVLDNAPSASNLPSELIQFDILQDNCKFVLIQVTKSFLEVMNIMYRTGRLNGEKKNCLQMYTITGLSG